jgi:hypothetical protein
MGSITMNLREQLIAIFIGKGIHCEILDVKNDTSSQLLFFLSKGDYVVSYQKEIAVGSSGISCFDVDIVKK